MQFHPYSEIFPLLDDASIDELAEDIKTHGLREKIWIYEGKILDGRNRFIACKKVKVKVDQRKYVGNDPISFVWSINLHRRHLKEGQRAMAAARMATLRHGVRADRLDASREASTDSLDASRDASTQTTAAENVGVSRSSVQRARKVLEKGSKALQKAVDAGDVPVTRAAAVVDLPKSEQLAAAKEKPKPEYESTIPPEASDTWTPDVDEDQQLLLAEKQLAEAIDKVMATDDRLMTAHAEIKRLANENAALKFSRDGYMNGKQTVSLMLKTEQRKVAKLIKEIAKANEEIAALRERIAIMTEAA